MDFKMVPCTIAHGFFKTEFYVIVGNSSAIVDRNILRVIDEPRADFDGHGFVKVFVIDNRDDQTLVELPGEPVVGGLRTWVPSSQIQEYQAVA